MYDADAASGAPICGLQRVRGQAAIDVACVGGATRLRRLHQSGAAKCLLPRRRDGVVEAVLLNTAGGITGGDRLDYQCTAGAGADLVATTQAAERIYRSLGDDGEVTTRLALGPAARLAWLPQETILFDGGRLRRSLQVEMAADATLVALEPLVLGRRAMGETVVEGFLSDQWRIRRGGRLVFADALRLTAPIDLALAARATGGGARALATLVYVAPDAEARRDAARALLAELTDVEAAASAWNGLLCIRWLATAGAPLRRALVAFLTAFRGAPPPPVWNL